MKKFYPAYLPLIIGGLIFTLILDSCKKDSNTKTTGGSQTSTASPIATLGLYEAQNTQNRGVFIGVAVGNSKTVYYSRFDTGSSAMTLQVDSTLVPKQYFSNAGFTFPGDSLVVNGITITKQTGTVAYGDATNGTTEYGNLAYAVVTIGDANGSVKTKRMPFFFYYKSTNTQTGEVYDKHQNDVFGVGPETKFNHLSMSSPLSYIATPANVTSGFKLAKFNQASFSAQGTYVSSLLTIGLVPDDISSTSGFVMHNLTPTSAGYSPNIPATITYNGNTIQGLLLFDTGTPSITIVEDPSQTKITTLPENASVSITTNAGFNYTYKVTVDPKSNVNTSGITTVEYPGLTGDQRTIFSIDFFINNQFLLDYQNHKIGLKN